MRLKRIYYKSTLNVDSTVELDSDAAHYLINVLRLKQNDELILFNGNDGDVLGELSTNTKREVKIHLKEVIGEPLNSGIYIHLALGLSKGDRMDYAIQKSVELGVSEITPLYTEFSVVKFREEKRLENKLGHWRRIAISSCEQSGAQSPPSVNNPITLSDFVEKNSETTKIVLDTSGEEKFQDLEIVSPISLLIGPEGGLSDNELKQVEQQGFTRISLGPRILRTETAPVAAIAILQNLYGNS
ncbi:MAG: 16S rRNA (uracil(1498)-N(3))-methyltransferase [Pseudomonadota bacterium]|nr:16S rRNA (uracil(1498)-N(3))-methyltransferase [Pseudomonadota bacterium]